ncbi:hypothetical protein VULLAG_LOCUS1561 [Vulpes lagopus]
MEDTRGQASEESKHKARGRGGWQRCAAEAAEAAGAGRPIQSTELRTTEAGRRRTECKSPAGCARETGMQSGGTGTSAGEPNPSRVRSEALERRSGTAPGDSQTGCDSRLRR